ncbi:hypothetical protein LPJ61_002802 [Coemansia biformis]|uniref:Homeobox domain-containing protein n=1 Tax=Coemansia biformis TaxID=1286918 RepID=A0A9W7Y7Q2_9FUNG|nr:hypothetical protein LPJ61_002802 [Coemansia biformis]
MHWSIDSQAALSLSALRATHMLLRGVPTPTLAAELSLDGYALQPSEPSPFTSLTLLMQQPCGDGFATPYSPPAAVPSLLAAAMPGMPPAPAPPFLGEAVPFLQAAEAVLHDNAMPSPESIRPVSAGRGDSPTPLAMPPTGTVTHGFFWGPAHSQGPPSRASAGAFSAAPIYDGSRAGAAPACSTPDQQMLWHGATTASLPLFGDLWPQFAADGPFEGAAPAPAGPAPGLAARYGKKRDTLSPETKTAFYQWMVDHMDDPYPKECDRVALTNGTMSKQAFKWWFSNHRHRSLEQYDDDKGNRCFRPAAPFVKACRRLGISIPWDIPADTRGRTQVRQR